MEVLQPMASSDTATRFTASKDALKTIYFVVIGLAVSESLNRVFLRDGRFLGTQVFALENLPSLLMLFTFLPTISRLAHGASIHLDAIHRYRLKPLFDFCGFFIQASMFYVMALSIQDTDTFRIVFSIPFAVDAAWLLFLWGISYIAAGSTEKQWIISDAVMFLVLWGIGRLGTALTPLVSAGVILCISSIATIADYVMNRNFYFPVER